MKTPVVILDRDGVINVDSTEYIKSPAEWQPIPGSIEAITRLHQAGARVFIATNQAGIARGKLNEASLHAIHEKMVSAVEQAGGKISGIYFCPHHPDDQCECRKPQPGMLLRIAAEAQLDLSEVPYVGDSLKDIQAAEAAGCKPVLVLTGNGSKTHQERDDLTMVYADLLEFSVSYEKLLLTRQG